MLSQNYTVRLILFSIFCSVLYPVLVVTWGVLIPKDFVGNVNRTIGGAGHLRARLADVQTQGPVDVLFLGSSLSYRGFDTRIWEERGYTSFNLGSSAQSPVQTEMLVNEFVDQLAPKLVIMEVYSILSASDGVESSLWLIANHKLDTGIIKMAGRVGNILTFNTLIYASARKAFNVDRDFSEPMYTPPDRYIEGGFVQHDSTEPDLGFDKNQKRTDPKPFQWNAFIRTCQRLKANNCRIIFVEAPTTKAYQEFRLANLTDADRWFSSQPNYLDMNSKVELIDSMDFYDSKHLQQTGVEKFNVSLIDTLKRRNWLPRK